MRVSERYAKKISRGRFDPVKGTFTFPFIFIYIFIYYRSKLSTQSRTVASDVPDENLRPSSQSPVPANSSSCRPLSPKPELDEVQNGITVLPLKSLASIKPFTGQAAIPHQMG